MNAFGKVVCLVVMAVGLAAREEVYFGSGWRGRLIGCRDGRRIEQTFVDWAAGPASRAAGESPGVADVAGGRANRAGDLCPWRGGHGDRDCQCEGSILHVRIAAVVRRSRIYFDWPNAHEAESAEIESGGCSTPHPRPLSRKGARGEGRLKWSAWREQSAEF
jgi:hypothetical protein